MEDDSLKVPGNILLQQRAQQKSENGGRSPGGSGKGPSVANCFIKDALKERRDMQSTREKQPSSRAMARKANRQKDVSLLSFIIHREVRFFCSHIFMSSDC